MRSGNGSGSASATVPVFTDHDAILADLSVTVLFREVQAQVPCTVGIGGDILPRSGGADHGEASGVVHVFSMAPIQEFCKGGCATFSTGTLKAPVVEVCSTEDLTIDQFEHTELIGEHITFGINSVAVQVCCRTIVAAQEETIFFDGLN